MHEAFQKITEKDGAALWAFDFQFGPLPMRMKVAVKNGRAQANLSDLIGRYWTGDESSEQEFEEKFEEFLGRLQGK